MKQEDEKTKASLSYTVGSRTAWAIKILSKQQTNKITHFRNKHKSSQGIKGIKVAKQLSGKRLVSRVCRDLWQHELRLEDTWLYPECIQISDNMNSGLRTRDYNSSTQETEGRAPEVISQPVLHNECHTRFTLQKEILSQKRQNQGAGKMTSRFRTQANLPEHPGLILSPHTVAHNHLQLQGIWHPHLNSEGARYTSGSHTCR